MKIIMGVDEVGRGPLAGPVAVGVVLFSKNNEKKIKHLFKDARDSKKLSPKKREEIAKRITSIQKIDLLRYIVEDQSCKVIDKKGINFAIQKCINTALQKLEINPKNSHIFLDGGLKAPKKFIYQKTIIRGDDKVLAISLASIIAKVSRDALMVKMAKKFPKYGFEVHKGYGTVKHRLAIKKYGLSEVHRRTFCHVDVNT